VNQYVEALLAGMISMMPPGYSMYSQVPIAYCDEQCQETKLCDDPSKWRCRKPRLDYVVWQDMTTDLVENMNMPFEQASAKAKFLSYTRPETYDEGLVRYVIIAPALWDASLRMTQPYCKTQCHEAKFEDKQEHYACHKRCLKGSAWRWARKPLAYLTMTVFGKESGFRADVHGGVTPQGLGDCTWKRDGRWAKPASPGARPILSTCRSFCLGQANLGRHGYVKFNGNRWAGLDLVGIDYDSTSRCTKIAMKNLSRARLYCTGRLAPRQNDWAAATLSGYGTGGTIASGGCSSKRLTKRATTFWKQYNHPRELTDNVKRRLAKPEVQAAIALLMNAPYPVYWNTPLPEPLPPQKLLPEEKKPIALLPAP
jgi:hypothetical protein